MATKSRSTTRSSWAKLKLSLVPLIGFGVSLILVFFLFAYQPLTVAAERQQQVDIEIDL